MPMQHRLIIIESPCSIVFFCSFLSFIYLAVSVTKYKHYLHQILSLMYLISQKSIGYRFTYIPTQYLGTYFMTQQGMHFIDYHQKYWIYICGGSKVLKNPITWQRLTIDQKRISRLFLSIRVIANIWLLLHIITSVPLPPFASFICC